LKRLETVTEVWKLLLQAKAGLAGTLMVN